MRIAGIIMIISVLFLSLIKMETDKILVIESHLNIAGQKIQDLQYQIDVLTSLQEKMK